jgi:hypothetical protein
MEDQGTNRITRRHHYDETDAAADKMSVLNAESSESKIRSSAKEIIGSKNYREEPAGESPTHLALGPLAYSTVSITFGFG